MSSTSVRVVSPQPTALSTVLERRRLCPITPYKASAWESLLRAYRLFDQYCDVLQGLCDGFSLRLLVLGHIQTPSNSLSLVHHCAAFNVILSRELDMGHYL